MKCRRHVHQNVGGVKERVSCYLFQQLISVVGLCQKLIGRAILSTQLDSMSCPHLLSLICSGIDSKKHVGI